MKRKAFGRNILDLDLHLKTLVELELDVRGNNLLLFKGIQLLGESETLQDIQDDNYFRLITPLLKLFTAKEAIRIISECIEGFGAYGYMENSHIPMYLRDA